MSIERLRSAEQNIEQIRESVHKVEIEQAKQGEQLSSINRLLERHEVTFGSINQSLSNINTTMARMQETANKMEITLQVNTNSLKEHMRRTENLEKRIEPIERAYWKLIGGFIVASTAGGLIASFLLKWFGV